MNKNNYVMSGMIRALMGLMLMTGLVVSIQAQPPQLIHYQGRLTTNTGAPITTAKTVFFSLWQGGSATAAGSGTQFYSEQANITPDSNGIFEHQVGSGTSVTGSLGAASFNTADAVYLQVAVGTTSTVLLPRVRVTSVGYAFVAGDAVGDIHPKSITIKGVGEVIDSSGNWVGSQDGIAGPAGNPQVTAVTDSTGGLLVVGDKLKIDGSALADSVVMIGGVKAPILSQSASQSVCRVPATVPSGLNAVELVSASTGGPSVLAAHVDVHRLLIWLLPGSGEAVQIVDASSQTVVASINVGFSIGTDKTPIQIAFAFEGAVVIIPENSGARLQAIDLTANPPAKLGSAQSAGSGVQARAVTVSPDNHLVVVTDYSKNRLRIAPLTDSTSNIFGNFSIIDEFPSGFYAPRALTFVGRSLLLTVGEQSGEIVALRRDPDTNLFGFKIFNDPGNTNLRNRIGAGTAPFAIRLTPDKTRVLVNNKNTANLMTYLVAPEGLSPLVSSVTLGSNALSASIDPTGSNIYSADSYTDILRTTYMNGGQLQIVGDTEGPDGSNENFQMAAVEPGSGRYVAVASDDGRLYFFDRVGGSLTPTGVITYPTRKRSAFALEFQP